jgi:hypothetical protein
MTARPLSCPPADEASAADFRACFNRRGARSIAQTRVARTRREAGLRAAALSVAAVIVAASWQVRAAQRGNGVFAAMTAPAPAEDDSIHPMPFETAGGSFPGSAYYYLAQDEAPQTLTPGVHGDGDAATGVDTLGGLTNPGPAARALTAGSGQDLARALDCLTAAVYYEAASEPDDGQRAVAQVVLNRVAHPSFPKTVCGVVYQGSERTTGCQFTFACDGAMLRPRAAWFWSRAQQVARAALAGYVFRPVGLATHYHTFAVHPVWDDAMNFIGQIGAHRFYRFPGVAGIPAAFRFTYAGGEPMAGPHPRVMLAAPPGPDATDPIALERAYEASLKQAGGQPALALVIAAPVTVPTPAYTSEVIQHGGDAAYRASNLPEGNGVRAEYQASGRWIGDPQ